MFIGVILVAVGVIALLARAGILSGSIWGYTWPVILIVAGLFFVFGRRHHRGMCGCWGHDEEKKKD